MTDASPRTRPEALFEKAKLDDSPTVVVTPEPGSRRNQLAKKVALKVLQRLQRDALVLTEGADVTILGPGDGLEATITVHDDRAWWHLATEGSIGLGRGYIEKWWDSPNPELVVQIAARNMDVFDEIRNKLATVTTPCLTVSGGSCPSPTVTAIGKTSARTTTWATTSSNSFSTTP